MTILVAEKDGTVYTDQPMFPLRFADSAARDVQEIERAAVADVHTVRAGIVALHHRRRLRAEERPHGEPGYACAECAHDWPCKSYILATDGTDL